LPVLVPQKLHEHLRALSEDLDAFADCLESGGDPDAFVEARRPAPPPEPRVRASPDASGEERDEFDRLARMGGGRSWRDVPPLEIPVADLDYDERDGWTDDQWIRAQRSGFLIWSENSADPDPEPQPVAPDTARFMRSRAWAATRRAMREMGEAAVEVEDLHPEGMGGWTGDQWTRAEASGLLERLPVVAWVELPDEAEAPAAEGPCQSSISSTFPAGGDCGNSTNPPAASANGTPSGAEAENKG
jgi:hypothetical protein